MPKILLVYPNLPLMLVPSLAIGLFTDLCKKEGCDVELFETTGYLSDSDIKNISPENRIKFSQSRPFSYEKDLGVMPKRYADLNRDFEEKIAEFKPDLLFMSVVEDAFWQALELLRVSAKFDVPHIVGGVFPTAAPDVCLSFEEVNAIGIGEGEEILKACIKAIEQDRDFDGIQGVWSKTSDGQIIKSEKPPLVDINQLNADYDLFDEVRFMRPMGGRIFKTIPVETYRGCPYTCTYCNSPMHVEFAKKDGQPSFLRRKTISRVREELKQVVDRYDPGFIYFVDDSFLARPKKEIFEFCEMYSEFKLPFWFNTRPENCTPEIMEALREVGVYRISFGIECGNEQYRKKVLLRSVTNEKLIRHFNYIADSGVAFSVNLIIGFPGETRDLVMDTVELTRSISGFDALTVSVFTPYHGTRLRDVAVRNQWLDSSVITKHTTSRSLLNMPAPYLNAEQINGLMYTIPFYCYFDKGLWPEIEKAEAGDEAKLEHFRERYNQEFLGTSQDKDDFIVNGGTGCRSNPKDQFVLSRNRLSQDEVELLHPL